MKIFHGHERAERAARSKANADGEEIVVFKGPGPDHIIVPSPDVRMSGVQWPGGRAAWSEIGRVKPSQKMET